MKEQGMEFKFSCKWFGIEFSGDPGYVERQLEKYEPYVLNALKLVDQEQKREEEHKPVREQYSQPRPPQPQPQPHQPPMPDGNRIRPPEQTRQWDRQPRFDQRPQPDDRRGFRPDPQRQSPNGPGQDARADQKKNEAPAQPVPVEAEELTRAAVSEGVSSELIYDALTGKGVSGLPTSGPVVLAEAEPLALDLGENERATAGTQVDFPLRRRTPRVREDELARIIDQKKPRTHHDRVMVFGYYMENDGGGSDFTGPEIKRCYEAANLDPGINIEQVINHATRSGFIVRFDKGRVVRYKLSTKGKRYVADGLRLA